MAFLYSRTRSPFYWIRFRDPETGKSRAQSTGFRVGNGVDKRAALELEAEKTLAERATGRASKSEGWSGWVKTFIQTHYGESESSLDRYLTAWRSVDMFLRETKITAPRHLTREHCFYYFTWRKKADVKNGKYRASHNTMLLEMKVLSLVMKEAKNRGYCKENPARELGIKRAPRKLYPEFSDAIIKDILEAIPKESNEHRRTFLLHSFLIGRWHGVRLNETYLNPQTDVWQQEFNGQLRWMILFRQKGGKDRPKFLHPELVPLMSKLKAEGAVQTYAKPDTSLKKSARAARTWFEFLKRHGIKQKLPNASFHSLRVTAASRMARAGVRESKAKEYLSHASTTVHEAYIRWQPEDMEECHGAL